MDGSDRQQRGRKREGNRATRMALKDSLKEMNDKYWARDGTEAINSVSRAELELADIKGDQTDR